MIKKLLQLSVAVIALAGLTSIASAHDHGHGHSKGKCFKPSKCYSYGFSYGLPYRCYEPEPLVVVRDEPCYEEEYIYQDFFQPGFIWSGDRHCWMKKGPHGHGHGHSPSKPHKH